MQKRQVTFQELDDIVGIQVLYDENTLNQIAKNGVKGEGGEEQKVPVFYKQPSTQDIELLLNRGQSYVLKSDK